MPEQIIIPQEDYNPISVSAMPDGTLLITQGLKSPVFVDRDKAVELMKAIKNVSEC